MGFFSHVSHAVSHAVKHVVHDVTHPQDVIKTAVKGVSKIGHGLDDVVHGHFKEGIGEIAGGIKNVADPAHIVGELHRLQRPITNPINKALAQAIKGVTGHNVLGSHPLNAVGTVVAGVATGGAAAALMGGATLAGSMAAGVSALESAGASIAGSVGSGLSTIGLDSVGGTVSGWGTALEGAAQSAMAASGSLAGQMGLSGSQAFEMNVGSGLTKAGQSVGDNMLGHILQAGGDKLTGAVSDQLAAGTGHAMGSFGWATDAAGKPVLVNGTLNEVASVTNNFGGTGVFSNSLSKALAKKGMEAAAQQALKGNSGQAGSQGSEKVASLGAAPGVGNVLVKGTKIAGQNLGSASFKSILSNINIGGNPGQLAVMPTSTTDIIGQLPQSVQLTAF